MPPPGKALGPHTGTNLGSHALRRLRVYVERVGTDFEAHLVERNGEVDPIHLLVNHPPKHPVSSLVNRLKISIPRRDRRLQPTAETRRSHTSKKYGKEVLCLTLLLPAVVHLSLEGVPYSPLEQQKARYDV